MRPRVAMRSMGVHAAFRLALGVGLAGMVGACEPGGTVGGPNPLQNPIITRFEVFPNPQNPGTGPFEIVAHASGEGLLDFAWSATGGLLSVATQSVAVAGAPLVPAFSAWQPPDALGIYEVSLVVTDSGGRAYRRIARFEVDRNVTRILEPRPAQVSRPGLGLF